MIAVLAGAVVLYIGLGDGGSGGDPERRGLDLTTPLGKILRIDPEPDGDRPYTVPADNPFAGSDTGACPRSTPMACATRGASPLTRTPARW